MDSNSCMRVERVRSVRSQISLSESTQTRQSNLHSNTGTFTPMHHDVLCSFSWSANLLGTKKWILFDPNESKLLFDRHQRNVIPDITKPDPSTYPNAHRAKRIECTQQAGEVMFVRITLSLSKISKLSNITLEY